MVNHMATTPIPVSDNTGHPADVFTAQTVLTAIFQDMYFPPVRWPTFAQILYGLMQNR
jgi:hypothetical protein